MKNKSLLILSFLIPAALFCQSQNKVLILGVDDFRPDALEAAHTPNLDSLIEECLLNSAPSAGEGSSTFDFTLDPNPASDEVMVKISGWEKNEPFRMEIYQVDGAPKLLREEPGKKTTIDISGFQPGLYFVVLTGNGRTVVKKLVATP